jgi:hypothetical protein
MMTAKVNCPLKCGEIDFGAQCDAQLGTSCDSHCSTDATASCMDGCNSDCALQCAANANADCASSCGSRCGSNCEKVCAGAQNISLCRQLCGEECHSECKDECGSTSNSSCDGKCHSECTVTCSVEAHVGCQLRCSVDAMTSCKANLVANCVATCSTEILLTCNDSADPVNAPNSAIAPLPPSESEKEGYVSKVVDAPVPGGSPTPQPPVQDTPDADAGTIPSTAPRAETRARGVDQTPRAESDTARRAPPSTRETETPAEESRGDASDSDDHHNDDE